ncbi:hypothetical protein TSARBOMBA_130 [Bacillus phage TsarBomba]|uniref:Uncharacterized protein n=1 Tax=Bacillus phage TsarBomba TaxID=1690456 RepID=A0A0K2CZR7_9CAUD|nr:hypothetical protein TSARBOMBA_130 [Bacillus phage TsarBomba]ALA13039.1 hypothetical protein TSARBOMBA_130 [Bacillus phage TsarBomba]
MKLKKEMFCGDLRISTEGEEMYMLIHPQTGVVADIYYTNATIQQVATFMTKAKAVYNKFMLSKEAERFKY